MSIHNIGFNEDLTKIIFQLSSNTNLSLLLFLYINFVNTAKAIPSFIYV